MTEYEKIAEEIVRRIGPEMKYSERLDMQVEIAAALERQDKEAEIRGMERARDTALRLHWEVIAEELDAEIQKMKGEKG